MSSVRLIVASLTLSGCGNIPADNEGTIQYAGAAQVEISETDTQGRSVVSRRGWILGGWLDRSASGLISRAGLGYRELDVSEAPMSCGVVIFVETEQQLRQAIDLTEQLFEGGPGPCVAQR
ncbi:MAG: hypothetical protein AAF674_20595 [Pseudomonadota bacterium]